jgi:dCMP deaminase
MDQRQSLVERPSWDETCMEMAVALAKRTRCVYHHIGCVVLSVKNLIVATGYNGPPRGFPHCSEAGCSKDKGGSCIGAHAEQNAILFCTGIPSDVLPNATWYLTASPCNQCMKSLANSGALRVVFAQEYRRRSGGVRESADDALTIARMAKIWVVQYDIATKSTTTILEGRTL